MLLIRILKDLSDIFKRRKMEPWLASSWELAPGRALSDCTYHDGKVKGA